MHCGYPGHYGDTGCATFSVFFVCRGSNSHVLYDKKIVHLCLSLGDLFGLNLRLRCLDLDNSLFPADIFCDSLGNRFLLLSIFQLDLKNQQDRIYECDTFRISFGAW